MLQCVAVCCSVLQCVAVCCSVLQYVAMCRSVLTLEGLVGHKIGKHTQCVCVCESERARVRVYKRVIERVYSNKRRYMGWLRLVGSLKLQVSFAEYGFFYKALLQKRPTILRSLLIVATPQEHTLSLSTTLNKKYESSCVFLHAPCARVGKKVYRNASWKNMGVEFGN